MVRNQSWSWSYRVVNLRGFSGENRKCIPEQNLSIGEKKVSLVLAGKTWARHFIKKPKQHSLPRPSHTVLAAASFAVTVMTACR
ncbi:hypothetical protein BN2475_700028 [Paraburkholderia ribeironis]|uniref:Uncharacterized protein n=1 Tax=Paraburkholderia ribeironis TaxID=1247936 RepID=A0A1N7SHP4_9BURK|nr:hypothetical protein BN2475_700028 [Paraburkholderia ribeironis]